MRPPIITQTKDYSPFYFNGENEDETATLHVNCGMFKIKAVFCLLFPLSLHPRQKKKGWMKCCVVRSCTGLME